MAFTLQAIVGSATYNLSDGNPFLLESVSGIGGAPVRRLSERGPFQDGDTDLGFRLEPRTITLSFNFRADSASDLDTHRDSLQRIFKPLSSTPIKLKFTRDDGKVRQIDCYRSGPADIPLIPLHRPGNLHRAVVQVRAADPTFYDPTQQSISFAGTAIAVPEPLEFVQNPTNGQAWSYQGTITGDWTVVFRTAPPVSPGAFIYAYIAALGPTTGSRFAFSHQNSTGAYITSNINIGTPVIAGTHNYMVVHTDADNTSIIYRDAVAVGTADAGVNEVDLSGTARYWRGYPTNGGTLTYWDAALPVAAVYGVALSTAQLATLNTAMNAGTVSLGTAAPSLDIVYNGDMPDFPIITLKGPISQGTITNDTTNEVLSFGTNALGSSDIYTIDLRYGLKTITDSSGSSQISKLSSASDLATWHLASSPEATGGTNAITVEATSVGTATEVTIAYYNRYISF